MSAATVIPKPLISSAQLARLVDGSMLTKCRSRIIDAKLPVNIGIVGKMGAGKSSFITLLLSALQEDDSDDPERIIRLARVASQDDHVTSRITEYQLPHASASGGVTITDTWGYSESNWSEFDAFLRGELANGYLMGSSLDADNNNKVRAKPTYADRMHAIIFVVSAQEAMADSAGKYAEVLKKFMHKCNQNAVRYIIVATKADELVSSSSSSSASASSSSLSSDEMFDVRLLYTDPDVVRGIQSMAKCTGLSVGEIYGVKGYTFESERNGLLEAAALRAFSECVNLAIESYQPRERMIALARQDATNGKEEGQAAKKD